MHVGVHESGQYDAVAQIHDLLGGVRLADLHERATGNDHPVLDQQSRVAVDPQAAAVERVLRRVDERATIKSHAFASR